MCRPRTKQDEFQVPRGHHLRKTVQYWGKDGTLKNPCRYLSCCRKSAFSQDFKFSVTKKRITLMSLAENSVVG
jgi:hypothetical protein